MVFNYMGQLSEVICHAVLLMWFSVFKHELTVAIDWVFDLLFGVFSDYAKWGRNNTDHLNSPFSAWTKKQQLAGCHGK